MSGGETIIDAIQLQVLAQQASASSPQTVSQLYASLPVPTREKNIRLLYLEALPAKTSPDESALIGRLLVASLLETPYFTALSYVWGSPSELQTDTLTLRTENNQDVELVVTTNCRDALRAIRRRYGAVCIWVDAICINQEDITERSSQVLLMEEIYSWASMVYVWLGPGSPEIDRAFRFLSRGPCRDASSGIFLDSVAVSSAPTVEQEQTRRKVLLRHITVNFIRRRYRMGVALFWGCISVIGWALKCGYPASVACPHSCRGSTMERIAEMTSNIDSLIRGSRMTAPIIEEISQLPWFQRRWTFQEIILPSNITLLSSSSALDWVSFLRGLGRLRQRHHFRKSLLGFFPYKHKPYQSREMERLFMLANIWIKADRPTAWNNRVIRQELSGPTTINDWEQSHSSRELRRELLEEGRLGEFGREFGRAFLDEEMSTPPNLENELARQWPSSRTSLDSYQKHFCRVVRRDQRLLCSITVNFVLVSLVYIFLNTLIALLLFGVAAWRDGQAEDYQQCELPPAPTRPPAKTDDTYVECNTIHVEEQVQAQFSYLVEVCAVVSATFAVVFTSMECLNQYLIVCQLQHSPYDEYYLRWPRCLNFCVSLGDSSFDSTDIYLGIVQAIRERQTGEKKDRSYAFYGVLRRLNVELSTLDYSKSVGVVYTELFSDLLNWNSRFLNMLLDVNGRLLPDAPSWVPNWSMTTKTRHLVSREIYNLWDSPPPLSISGSTLTVTGTWRGSVSYCSGSFRTISWEWMPPESPDISGRTVMRATALSFALWADFLRRFSATIPEYKHIPLAMAKVLDCDGMDFDSSTEIIRSASSSIESDRAESLSQSFVEGPDFDKWYQAVSYIPLDVLEEAQQLGLEKINDRFEQTIIQHPHSQIVQTQTARLCNRIAGKRNVFSTTEGYAGSGLESMQKGDMIALIDGVRVPMVLREAQPKQNPAVYTVVGPTYMLGLMDLESYEVDPDAKSSIILV